jgi:hypothetical protein
MAEVHPATMIAAEKEVVGCELGDSLALLNLKSNIYYTLNEVGAFVWNEMSQPVTFGQLCRKTEQEFGAGPERVHQDLANLVSRMDEAKLVRCFRR